MLFVVAIGLFGVLGWFAASAEPERLGRMDIERMTTIVAEETEDEPSPDDTVPEFRLPPIPSAKDLASTRS